MRHFESEIRWEFWILRDRLKIEKKQRSIYNENAKKILTNLKKWPINKQLNYLLFVLNGFVDFLEYDRIFSKFLDEG